ncbi:MULTISPECIES: hypothetical protein [Streptomyces rochei group]|uniref:Uncharacterized protein n=1 Tax=Streptomyces plicatus TaxID=1922 RepID=A0ABW1XRF5_STRPL|nr:hypothetical protein [Streptomyces plicatus]GGZ88290.1 hypothetical protein GCM10010301_70770 [Streptomyces plicatus]
MSFRVALGPASGRSATWPPRTWTTDPGLREQLQALPDSAVLIGISTDGWTIAVDLDLDAALKRRLDLDDVARLMVVIGRAPGRWNAWRVR